MAEIFSIDRKPKQHFFKIPNLPGRMVKDHVIIIIVDTTMSRLDNFHFFSLVPSQPVKFDLVSIFLDVGAGVVVVAIIFFLLSVTVAGVLEQVLLLCCFHFFLYFSPPRLSFE